MTQQLEMTPETSLDIAPEHARHGSGIPPSDDIMPAGPPREKHSTADLADDAQPRVRSFRPDRIRVGRRVRALNPKQLEVLATSISTIGLRSPITVQIVPTMVVDGVEDVEVPLLVTGLHRLEAAKRLGMELIDCVIEPGSELDAQLWEIDENLCRADLTELERAEHLQKRKTIYEQMCPEARQGGLPGAPGGGKAKTANLAGFATDTAAKTGISERTIRRDTRRASKIDPAVRDRIRGNREIADIGAELDALVGMPVAEQKQVVGMVDAGQASSVREAKKLLEERVRAEEPTQYASGPQAARSGESRQSGQRDECAQFDGPQSEDARPRKEPGQPEPAPHAEEAETTRRPEIADSSPLDTLLAAWNRADKETRAAFLNLIGARPINCPVHPVEPESVELGSVAEGTAMAAGSTPAFNPTSAPGNQLAEVRTVDQEPHLPGITSVRLSQLIEIYELLPPNTQKWAKWWVLTGAPAEDTRREVIRTTEARAPLRDGYPAASPECQAAFRQHLECTDS